MNTFKRIASCGLLAVLSLACAFGQQNTLVQTSLSAAITANQTSFAVASATGINAPTAAIPGSALYVVDLGEKIGEVMPVTAVSSTTVTVRRSGAAKAHASGAMVLVATAPNWFQTVDPAGSCTATSTYVTPWLNALTGNQWLCSTVTGTWVPGWGNTIAPPGATAAVASAAGKITPSGPLFHVTGTAAITGFNLPLGYNGGSFCVIPDGIFTTTAANEIALATTAVVSKSLCYQYDGKAAKPYFPSY